MDAATEDTRQCPDCEAAVDKTDNYCRNCGMFMTMERQLPIERPATRAIQQRASNLPTPVKRAAAAVAIGAVLQVGASLAGKYLLKQAAQSLKPEIKGPGRSRKQRRNVPAKAEASAEPIASVVSETFVVRRVWMRRGD